MPGTVKTGAAEPPPSPNGRPGRARQAFRDSLFFYGVLGVATAISIGVAFIDPVHFYDCARQASGSVDCTVHRRVWGVVPLGDVRVPDIVSVDVKSGEHSETMSERSRRLSFGSRRSSYDVLLLTRADGTRWQSPESSWPMGRTLHEQAAEIQALLEGRDQTYRGWTASKVTLVVSAAFLAPHAFILLGLVLRLLLPRSFVEAGVPALRAWARRRQGSRYGPD